MIQQKQLFLHDPTNGVYGDCFRTVIASLLDLPAAEAPHFNADTGAFDMAEQDRLMNAWLAERKLSQVCVPFDGGFPLAELLAMMERLNPGVRFMLTGQSRTGCNHCVICLAGEIEWDPSQTDAGIIGPADDGNWWVTYLGAKV